jgi:hypothetical protein
MPDMNRYALSPILFAAAGCGFYVAYRLFGSNSESKIKLTVVVGFLLAAVLCCVTSVLWDMIGRSTKRK